MKMYTQQLMGEPLLPHNLCAYQVARLSSAFTYQRFCCFDLHEIAKSKKGNNNNAAQLEVKIQKIQIRFVSLLHA